LLVIRGLRVVVMSLKTIIRSVLSLNRVCALMITATVLLGATILICFLSKPNEPTYHGRPLTYWLSMCDTGWHEDATAEKAIQHIGTNGIPTIIRLLERRKSVFDRIRNQNRSRVLAERGFEVLGERAKPAIPELIRLTKSRDPEIRYTALRCIFECVGSTPDLEAFVAAPMLKDSNLAVRALAQKIYEHPEIYAIPQIRDSAK